VRRGVGDVAAVRFRRRREAGGDAVPGGLGRLPLLVNCN
jgi:hypothetical protein